MSLSDQLAQSVEVNLRESLTNGMFGQQLVKAYMDRVYTFQDPDAAAAAAAAFMMEPLALSYSISTVEHSVIPVTPVSTTQGDGDGSEDEGDAPDVANDEPHTPSSSAAASAAGGSALGTGEAPPPLTEGQDNISRIMQISGGSMLLGCCAVLYMEQRKRIRKLRMAASASRNEPGLPTFLREGHVSQTQRAQDSNTDNGGGNGSALDAQAQKDIFGTFDAHARAVQQTPSLAADDGDGVFDAESQKSLFGRSTSRQDLIGGRVGRSSGGVGGSSNGSGGSGGSGRCGAGVGGGSIANVEEWRQQQLRRLAQTLQDGDSGDVDSSASASIIGSKPDAKIPSKLKASGVSVSTGEAGANRVMCRRPSGNAVLRPLSALLAQDDSRTPSFRAHNPLKGGSTVTLKGGPTSTITLDTMSADTASVAADGDNAIAQAASVGGASGESASGESASGGGVEADRSASQILTSMKRPSGNLPLSALPAEEADSIPADPPPVEFALPPVPPSAAPSTAVTKTKMSVVDI
jgi:hypothetical protein